MFNLNFLKRVITKPLPVVFFRFRQEMLLKYRVMTGYWGRKSIKIENYYTANHIFDSLTVLIYPEPIILNDDQSNVLKETSFLVSESKFNIFGHRVPNLELCDFSTDWRFGKKWDNQYYKKYRFYEEKEIPYDIKFPWELSRFHYLIPVLAWQWTDKTDDKILTKVLQILCRWRSENPLAYSVNWYPMEASMRVINFVIMIDFVRLLKIREENSSTLKKLEKQILIMLAEHGEFIWANREFTDIRGNHFTANLVALLLISYVLEAQNYSCKKWHQYAIKWLDKEIFLQFCTDGVNFEKSCAYHKLVLELFLLAALAKDRKGEPFTAKGKAVLEKATYYSDAVMGPNGVAANFGDTDDAMALPFTIDNPRSHAPVIELARAYFNKDIGTVTFTNKDKLAALFMLGSYHSYRRVKKRYELLNFKKGGYVIVRCQESGFFFMADIGEVGMKGRGGHGHNDLLAFELYIAGQPIVVDPGCSGYTADLKKKEQYKSTFNHATIGLFGEEIARFSGCWTILNDAHPTSVNLKEDSGVVTLIAGHNGYERIAVGNRILRKFVIKPIEQKLTIKDTICIASVKADVLWTFPLEIHTVTPVTPNRIKIQTNKSTNIIVDSSLPVSLAPYHLSYGYGQEIESKKIVAESQWTTGVHCSFIHFYQNQELEELEV